MSVSVGTASLPIQRLCSHHVVQAFDCGDEAFNIILEEYHRHVYDMYDQIAVLCLVNGLDVVGYVACKDMYVRATDNEDLLMFLIPALAVTREFQGDGVAAGRLIDAAYRILGKRQSEGHSYKGIACIPHSGTGTLGLLRRQGFEPLAANSFFWSKRVSSP